VLSFAVRRLGESAIVLLVVSFASYGLIGLMPGDPIDLMFSADPDMTAADAQRLREVYGLDRPLLERYAAWLGGALTGEFGYSRLYQQPVGDILLPTLGATLQLLGSATVLSLAIAIPLGVLAAARPNSATDTGINLLCFGGISIPPFWLALLLIAYVAVPVSWVPAGGMAEPNSGLAEHLRHMLLPTLALTLASIGGFTRFMRGAMRQALGQDYMRTARAKGAGAPRRLFGHALRNALLPLVTVVALSFGTLFSGALITETIFGWNGMGRTIYAAIMGNDYNLALIGLMVATGFTLLANILADIAYAALDPRIRLDGSAGAAQ
jgi:peptide/nickel transport system permease protein